MEKAAERLLRATMRPIINQKVPTTNQTGYKPKGVKRSEQMAAARKRKVQARLDKGK